jgi:hypothetical protein
MITVAFPFILAFRTKELPSSEQLYPYIPQVSTILTGHILIHTILLRCPSIGLENLQMANLLHRHPHLQQINSEVQQPMIMKDLLGFPKVQVSLPDYRNLIQTETLLGAHWTTQVSLSMDAGLCLTIL